MRSKRSLALVLLTAGLVALVLSLIREEGRVAQVATGADEVEPRSEPDPPEKAPVVRSAVLDDDPSESPEQPPLDEARFVKQPGDPRALHKAIEALGGAEDWMPSLPAILEIVVRGAAGEPIVGHEVRVMAYRDGVGASWSGSTDESGWCEIADVPSGVELSMRLYRGDVLLCIYSEGLELAPAERRRIEWVPSGVGACTLTGQVHDEDGGLVDGLEISLARGAQRGRDVESAGVAVVDALGRFELAGIPSGVFWFRVARGESTLTVEPGFVHVKHDDQQRFVELRVREALYLCGSVVGPAEEPVGDATVTATGRSTGAFVQGATDEQGAFELGPLADDEYRIQASGRVRIDGTHPLPEERARLAFLGDSPALLARAGDQGVVLRLRATGSMQVTLRSEGGEQADRASVTAQLFVSGRPEQSFTASASDRFSFERLPPGSYHVAAATERGLFGARADVLVTGGEDTEVELTLRPGARLVVIPAPGRPEILRAWQGETLACNTWIDADEPTEVIVPAGELRVEILENSAVPRVVEERSLALAPGAEHRIDRNAPAVSAGTDGK